jgi:GntR family transcriptional regulator, transcriptional repressor for pyruvate dehydrogenase complex
MGVVMQSLNSKRPKVSDLVVEEIKNMVRTGQLHQGDKLPNQNEFAQQLGVSRPSLREALSRLTKLGIIAQSPGVGTILKAENPDLWVENPPGPLFADSEATLELIEARICIESLAVEFAVERITKGELTALAHSVKKMQQAIVKGDYRTYLQEDVSFHCQLANASHNRYFIHMHVTLRGLMQTFTNDMYEHFPDLVSNSYDHHQGILESIQARDKERAVQEIRSHIEDLRLSLVQYYRNAEAGVHREKR